MERHVVVVLLTKIHLRAVHALFIWCTKTLILCIWCKGKLQKCMCTSLTFFFLYTCGVLFWLLHLHSAHKSWLTVRLRVKHWYERVKYGVYSHFSLQNEVITQVFRTWRTLKPSGPDDWSVSSHSLAWKHHIHLALVKTGFFLYIHIRVSDEFRQASLEGAVGLQIFSGSAHRTQLWTRGGRSAVLPTHSRFPSSRFF